MLKNVVDSDHLEENMSLLELSAKLVYDVFRLEHELQPDEHIGYKIARLLDIKKDLTILLSKIENLKRRLENLNE